MSLMSKLGWVLLIAPLSLFGAWITPSDISESLGTRESSSAINSTGVIAASWTSWDGSTNRVGAAIYTGTWGPPVTLSACGVDSFTSSIGIDDAGNAIVVWIEFDGTNFLVKGNVYTSSTTTWGTPTTLSDRGVDSLNARISVNSSGDAVVVWTTFDTYYLGKSIDYVSGTWGSVQTFSDAGRDVNDLRFDLSDAGNGIAVWSTLDGTNFIIKSAEYSAGSWSTTVQLSSASVDSSHPQISMNTFGDGMAVWAEADGQWNIVEKTFVSGVWDTSPTKVSTSANVFFARVGYNNAGNAVVIWHDYEKSSNILVVARAYDASTTSWGAIQQLSSSGRSSEYSSKVKLNNDTVAVAITVWAEYTGTNYVITSSKYDFATDTWTTPVALSRATDDSMNITLDLNDSGDAITTYDNFGGVDWAVEASIGTI